MAGMSKQRMADDDMQLLFANAHRYSATVINKAEFNELPSQTGCGRRCCHRRFSGGFRRIMQKQHTGAVRTRQQCVDLQRALHLLMYGQ